MKTTIHHLPPEKINQVLEIVSIIKEAVEPEMIILFGSYAKGTYVEHRYTGKDGIIYEYISDFDFLVVTKENTIKEYELDDIVNSRTEHFKQPINIQMHEIDYINEGLEFGQYFFADIVKEGIRLYDTDIVKFAQPREQTPEEEKLIAQRYFDLWYTRSKEFFIDTNHALSRKSLSLGTFYLHQATESLYYSILLVFTGYKPKTHNLFKLRKFSKHLSEELFLVFAVETSKQDKHLFDLLKRGYIDARYKETFSITEEELLNLIERIKRMQNIVEQICISKIHSFC
jgi:HEPN domain-containing protein/predicted nucleotidyltransferase